MQTYPGFTLHTQDGIYIFRIYDITREAVDAWYEADKAQSIASAAITGHAMRLMHITNLIFPTTYFASKLRQSNAETPAELYESTAIVIHNPLAFHTVRTFLQRDVPNFERNVRRFFQTEAPATEWLLERRDHIALLKESDATGRV